MAGNISLTKANIEYLRQAFSHFFPEDTIYAADKPFESGEFNWKNRADFIDFVYRLTGIQIISEKDFGNIKKAQLEVENLLAKATPPETPVESNLPDKEARDIFEAERQARERAFEKAKSEAETSVRKSVEKKQEIYKSNEKLFQVAPPDAQTKVLEELKGKYVYAVPATKAPEIVFTENEQKFVEIAKSNPKLFSQKLSELIIQNNPDVPVETLKPLSQVVAADTTQALLNPVNRPIPTGVIAATAKVSEVVPNFSQTTQDQIAKTVSVFTTFSESKDGLYRTILLRSVGENITNTVLGPAGQQYVLSDESADGAFKINLDQYQSNSFSFQKQDLFSSLNSPVSDNLKDIAGSELKNIAFEKTKSLEATGALGKLSDFANSRMFDNIAPFLGLQTNFEYVGTNVFGNVITKAFPEFTPVVTTIAEKMGIDIGIKVIAPVAESAVTAEAAVVAGGGKATIGIAGKGLATVATKLGLKGIITAAGQALGSFAPIVGNIIAFVATEIIAKIAEKIPWRKIGKWIVGGVIGVGTYFIAGPLAGVVAGVAAFGVASAVGGGAGVTIGTVGSGIAGLFATLGSAIVMPAAMPILITVIVMPIVVAVILFVINSGAYVVPPTSNVFGSVSSPYIGITKTPSPAGPFKNSELSKTINYTITIIAKKGSLSDVNITYDCQVISGTSKSCPGVSTRPDTVDSISPSNPYTFTYTSTYGPDFKDSAVIDTVTVTAVTTDGTKASSDTSASVTFGSPPISCPIPGGKPLNSMNYSYNSQSNTGHGSVSYWQAMGNPYYRYPLPQLTGCFKPEDCSYYGYSYDVFPNGVTSVYAPTILGKSVTWNLVSTFTNPGAGYSLVYTDAEKNNTIVLTHVDSNTAIKTVASGTKITNLFNQGGNTHLHLEFQTNGRWVKPENYFCK